MTSNNQIIYSGNAAITLAVKREDLIHPVISGNKYRKLKYNLLRAEAENHSALLTFGGAFSNHIAAVAAAGKEYGFKTIGIIRGEELIDKIAENPTLQYAEDCGMQLEFVTREDYRQKDSGSFLANLKSKYGSFYLIPEGGTNDLAVKGCEEILGEQDSRYDYICCAVGTGGTISGIINSCGPNQKVLGFPVLKGSFLKKEIVSFANNYRWELIQEYHFGGYAKINKDLIDFMNAFYKNEGILLDPIYTGKLLFGVMDLIKKGFFPDGSKVLVIHTGGIQGIKGMNLALKNKNLPLINYHD